MNKPYSECLIRLHPRSGSLTVHRDRTVLVTGDDGFIDDKPDHGLFVHQTRLLSRYRYLINGRPLEPVAVSPMSPHRSLGYYICLPPDFRPDEPDRGSGHVPAASQQSLELRLTRTVSPGFQEEVALTNFTQQPTSFRLDLDFDADFADAEETRWTRQQKGWLAWKWKRANTSAWTLSADYRVKRGRAALWRGFVLKFLPDSGVLKCHVKRVSVKVRLAPHRTWRMRVELTPHIEGKWMTERDGDRKLARSLREATDIHIPSGDKLACTVHHALRQAKYDLTSLRFNDFDRGDPWTMAAGIPIYVALFGRDTLTASWQAAMLGPDMMRGTLMRLKETQGRDENDWRDEQPGRMLHEAHTGPLSVLNITPRRRYYGAATTSAFYPVILSELWHWTGKKEWVLPFVKPALDAIHWLDTYADSDKDGFYEYRSHSAMGVKNQGWKDSGDAIVDEDGLQVNAPIATCEEQAFVYIAKLHLSEVLWWLDQKDIAKRLYHEAGELKKRFNETFWIEKKGFFAMGLGPDKRPISSIGSNTGHCLAAAIVDKSLVRRTMDRLFSTDLFSGWGVRTLSTENPAYNPYSYHRGSVWPVEQGTFALACMRYGLFDRLDQLSRSQFELASLFDYHRLPELVSGHSKDATHPFPAIYPHVNWPQAWSSSAVYMLLQSLLGLYPFAPLHMLLVDPHLPPWFPDVTLTNLRVGPATITIRFFREKNGRSNYDIVKKTGRLHVVRQPSPWSLTAGFAERVKDALASTI